MTDKELKKQKKREERDRIVRETQEKQKAARQNESMWAWVCRTFRVITILGTILMAGMTWYKASAGAVDNVMPMVVYSALGAWCTFGLVWVVSAVGVFFKSEKDLQARRKLILNAGIPVIIACILGTIFMGM